MHETDVEWRGKNFYQSFFSNSENRTLIFFDCLIVARSMHIGSKCISMEELLLSIIFRTICKMTISKGNRVIPQSHLFKMIDLPVNLPEFDSIVSYCKQG